MIILVSLESSDRKISTRSDFLDLVIIWSVNLKILSEPFYFENFLLTNFHKIISPIDAGPRDELGLTLRILWGN